MQQDSVVRYHAHVRLASFQFDTEKNKLVSLRTKEPVHMDLSLYRDRFYFDRVLSDEVASLLALLPCNTEMKIVYDEEGWLCRVKTPHLEYWLDDPNKCSPSSAWPQVVF